MKEVRDKFDFGNGAVVATSTGGAMLGASIGHVPGLIIGGVLGALAGAWNAPTRKHKQGRQKESSHC